MREKQKESKERKYGVGWWGERCNERKREEEKYLDWEEEGRRD